MEGASLDRKIGKLVESRAKVNKGDRSLKYTFQGQHLIKVDYLVVNLYRPSLGSVRADARHLHLCNQHNRGEGPQAVRESDIQEARQKRGYYTHKHKYTHAHTRTQTHIDTHRHTHTKKSIFPIPKVRNNLNLLSAGELHWFNRL